ncbi:MoaD/ThiS family protein [Streptomyces sp. NPDC090077]|uniref:MoaD/ThiS family protein n=1 Tax=Streptomyces sp. NPDC090077 TaxID=3365938 RepID=UPI00380AF2FA
MPYVQLPQAWTLETGGEKTIPVTASTVLEALSYLAELFPLVRKRLFTDRGRVASWVTVSLEGELIPGRAAAETSLGDGETVMVIPAMAGG